MSLLSAIAPAKINLFLAVTGRRTDGFHDLVSLVAPLQWGDSLSFEPGTVGGGYRLDCEEPGVPLDASNLILKAADLYARRCPAAPGGCFRLEKRIPMGAGLGGGSSDASTALLLLEQATGGALGEAALDELAAAVGSDCPLFLRRRAVVMRGRGERVTLLAEAQASRLSGQRVLLFKPEFGISTPWAYGRLAAAAPSLYLPEERAEARLQAWLGEKTATLESLLYNNMEAPAFSKYLALPTLLEQLRRVHGLPARMSGSGSCCFALLPESLPLEPVKALILQAWGPSAFVQETRLA